MLNLGRELADLQTIARGRYSPEQKRLLDQFADWLLSSGAVSAATRCGELSPDFDLPDVHGRQVSLNHLLDRGPVVVTFFCGSWCPLCATTVRAYQQTIPGTAREDGTLIAVTLEATQGAATLSQGADSTTHVVSDRGGRISRLYGLLYVLPPPLIRLYMDIGIDLPERNDSRRWELPLPATYVVDTAGVVVFGVVGADHRQRAEPEDLIAALARSRPLPHVPRSS